MSKQNITFDEVFKFWLEAEVNPVEGRNILGLAQARGFSSITEWRLKTALRLGMDKKQWTLENIGNPNDILPNIIIGPYKGWSQFFENKLNTSFAQALEIPAFFQWCQNHDRIIPLANNFPLPTTIIVFQKENGQLIHIEGGHRICAVAYRKKLGNSIEFTNQLLINAAIAPIQDHELTDFIALMQQKTDKI